MLLRGNGRCLVPIQTLSFYLILCVCLDWRYVLVTLGLLGDARSRRPHGVVDARQATLDH